MDISDRLIKSPASPIRKLVPYATYAKKSGVTVHHLNIGDPDIKTPKVMLDVLHLWNIDPIGYDQSQGNPEFIASLHTYYSSLGFSYIQENNIQVTSGGSEAISMAMFAVCNPGDEIIVFEPFYANYNGYAVVNGISLVPVTTDISNGFHLPNKQDIVSKISTKTKAILICNPNNPTGTVYAKNEMDMLVSIACEHNLYLLADEVYREFVYDNKKQISILSYMNAYPDKMILLDSLSKRYSLCGARLGVLLSMNEEIMSGVLRLAQARLSAGFIDQTMASKLTEIPLDYIENVKSEYTKRRDLLYSGLSSIKGVVLQKPEGAFYTIVGLPVDNAESFAKWLLTDFRYNNETVMVAPASGFYKSEGKGVNEVRIAYVLNCDKIQKCIDILRKAIAVYTRKP